MNRSLKVPIVIILILGISAPAALAQNSVYGAAMSWYERGAREGSAKEQYLLGLLYEKGVGPRVQDAGKALRWFFAAAEQGHSRAQYKIASSYHFGKGIGVDLNKAAVWYRRAAVQGLPQAQYNLAYMLEKLSDLGGTPQEAAKWYSEAAIGGVGAAQLALGSLYVRGVGVPRDLSQAWAWLRAAESRQISRAGEVRAALEQFLPPAQLSQAQDLAKSRLAR